MPIREFRQELTSHEETVSYSDARSAISGCCGRIFDM
jgi:hypothetical protein